MGENSLTLPSPLLPSRREGKGGRGEVNDKRTYKRTTNKDFIKLIISGPLGTQSIFIPNLFNIEILSDSLKISPFSLLNETIAITKEGYSGELNLKNKKEKIKLEDNLDNKTKRKRNQLWGTL